MKKEKPKKRKNRFHLRTRIERGLRRVWLHSPLRYQAIKDAFIERGKYRCAVCEGIFKAKELQVDHRYTIGHLAGYNWDLYIQALFYGEQRAVCKPCHKDITAAQRKVRDSRARLNP